MPDYIPVDRSARCQIRTTRVLVPSQQSAQGPTPVAVPARPLPGRRWLRILNHGVAFATPGLDHFVVVGGADVRWTTSSTSTIWGHGLDRLESIDLPIEDSVAVYCVATPDLPAGEFIDLRTIELA